MLCYLFRFLCGFLVVLRLVKGRCQWNEGTPQPWLCWAETSTGTRGTEADGSVFRVQRSVCMEWKYNLMYNGCIKSFTPECVCVIFLYFHFCFFAHFVFFFHLIVAIQFHFGAMFCVTAAALFLFSFRLVSFYCILNFTSCGSAVYCIASVPIK